jgi:hypothetical protein
VVFQLIVECCRVGGEEGNGKVREMQFGSCGCCPDLGAGLGDQVPAPHKNYGRLG